MYILYVPTSSDFFFFFFVLSYTFLIFFHFFFFFHETKQGYDVPKRSAKLAYSTNDYAYI